MHEMLHAAQAVIGWVGAKMTNVQMEKKDVTTYMAMSEFTLRRFIWMGSPIVVVGR